MLRGSSVSGAPGGKLRGAFEISRAVAHGDACAVLAALRACGIDKAIDPRHSPARDLAVALVAQRVLRPGSKLAAARGFRPESASSTLAAQLKLPKDVCANRLYEAMDWLLGRQPRIEKALAEKYLKEGKSVPATSPRPGATAGTARWPGTATAGTASGGCRRSSSGCCATAKAGPSPSKPFPATPPIRRRCPRKSASCGSASG